MRGLGERECLDFGLNGEILEEVDSFKYLGSVERKNGGIAVGRGNCVSIRFKRLISGLMF